MGHHARSGWDFVVCLICRSCSASFGFFVVIVFPEEMDPYIAVDLVCSHEVVSSGSSSSPFGTGIF